MLDGIRTKIANGDFEFSRHALDGSLARRISVTEVKEAVAVAEIIEDYPNDRDGPSCLLFGRTLAGRALHVHSSPASRPLIKVITLYEPDPVRWDDCKVRRSVE